MICGVEDGMDSAFFISGTGLCHWWFSDGCFIFECLVQEISKLFCVLGGIMGPYHIFCGVSGMHFLTGAAAFAGHSDLVRRFPASESNIWSTYMKTYIRNRRTESLITEHGTAWENIHFTVPVFMSVMLYAGGMY